MNIVYRYLDIICQDSSGEEIKIYSCDYDESIDEIKVRTNIRPTQLNRGWIGDLTYTTVRAQEIESSKEIEDAAKSEYKDVLLASIIPWTMDEGVITWEYRFLKK
jgi:hypothetical protein